MEKILQGLNKFQEEVFPRSKHLFEELADGQSPEVLFITCADSRVVPSLITQTDPGELFICRNAGNIVPPYGEVLGGVSATIEYAVAVLNVKEIIVCGHTNCGAMKGILHPESVQELPAVRSWLHQGEIARRVVKEAYPDLKGQELLDSLTRHNVIAQLDHLRTHPSVAARLMMGKLRLHGWVYHIATGEVDAYNPQLNRFTPIKEHTVSSLQNQGVLAGS